MLFSIYNVIYLPLAMLGLLFGYCPVGSSLAVASGGYSLAGVRGFLIVVASPVGNGLQSAQALVAAVRRLGCSIACGILVP